MTKREYNRLWKKTPAGRACTRRENATALARARKQRYARSARGRAMIAAKEKRYARTSNGRAANLRKVLKWQKANPDKTRLIKRVYSAARRARECFRCEDYPAVERIYARCRELRQWFDVVVDHIIPLAKGGAHVPQNLQIIYRSENQKKGARLDYTPVVVFV